MGYSTEFRGEFTLDKPLSPEHKAYLDAFSATRRMKRDSAIAETLPDPIRIAAGLPIGIEGEYFVGNTNDFGQDHDVSVINYNSPPSDQPGLWNQWTPSEDGKYIEWDGGEKFYNYIEWLEYIIERFIGPWGYKLNGEVDWRGESWDDTGTIEIIDNKVTVKS